MRHNTTRKTYLTRVLTLLTLTFITNIPVCAQWNTDGTPVCIYENNINTWGNFHVTPTADKKFWLSWAIGRTAGNRPVINDIERISCSTYLQLVDSNGIPQFQSPLLVNDHMTNSYLIGNSLQAADDGSAIVTVSDGRTEEVGIADDTKKASTFTPAIYRINQQGQFLWGADGIACEDFTNVGLTNGIYTGNDTYFSFYDTENGKTFIQRFNDDGIAAWENLKSWDDPYTQLQLLPVSSQQLMRFEPSEEGSMVYMLDSDLNEVWKKTYADKKYESYVYNSYQLATDGQGGAFSAFAYNTGGFTHNIRVQHILNDGTLAFGTIGKDFGTTTNNDYGLVNEDYDYPRLAVNTDRQEIMLLSKSKADGNTHVALQKFKYDGTPLFGDTGLTIDSKDASSGYNFSVYSVKSLSDGDWIVVYTDNTGYMKQSIIVKRIDTDGNIVWSRKIGEDNYSVSELQHCYDNEASYIFYRDSGTNKAIRELRIFHNGSFTEEATAVTAIQGATTSGQQYFTLYGRQILSPRKGLNIVRTADGRGDKVIVK